MTEYCSYDRSRRRTVYMIDRVHLPFYLLVELLHQEARLVSIQIQLVSDGATGPLRGATRSSKVMTKTNLCVNCVVLFFKNPFSFYSQTLYTLRDLIQNIGFDFQAVTLHKHLKIFQQLLHATLRVAAESTIPKCIFRNVIFWADKPSAIRFNSNRGQRGVYHLHGKPGNSSWKIKWY